MNLILKNRTGLIAGLFLVLFGVALVIAPSQAQIGGAGGDPLGVQYPSVSGLSNADVRVTTARTIRILLSLLGIVFLGITVYGGYEWMTSAGNDERVAHAKKSIYTGVIGMVIILASYSITWFVIVQLTNASF